MDSSLDSKRDDNIITIICYYHSCASSFRPKGVSDILTGPARDSKGGLRQNILKFTAFEKIVANLI